MLAVWKFPFVIDDRVAIAMPKGAKVLMVDCQNGTTCMWAQVDPSQVFENRIFRITGTGHDIPENHVHVGSFQQPPFVWHVWEAAK